MEKKEKKNGKKKKKKKEKKKINGWNKRKNGWRWKRMDEKKDAEKKDAEKKDAGKKESLPPHTHRTAPSIIYFLAFPDIAPQEDRYDILCSQFFLNPYRDLVAEQ